MVRLLLFAVLFAFAPAAFTQTGPKVLVVTAHPDDETGACVAIYKITHELHGTVDLALITNGEGGYKYSTLAEAYYGMPLTDEADGRNNLPSIRKKELMNGGKILGLRNYYFFDQKDHKYTTDLQGVLESIWDTVLVKRRLASLLKQEKYDYVLCLLPVPETHAHHKCASIIALQVVNELPTEQRPITLGFSVTAAADTAHQEYKTLEGFSVTALNNEAPVFKVDRTTPFGYKNKLNYKVIANWVIAEHKSQGVMQLYMNMGDIEWFYFFAINDPVKLNKAGQLFTGLQKNPYKAKVYTE